MPELIPINLIGGDYEHKSRPLSNQVTRNFWPQKQQNAKVQSPYILQSFYGLIPWAPANMPTATAGRGLFVNKGVLYRVADTNLYSVDLNGVHTKLGQVPGSGRCIFDAVDKQLVAVANRAAFCYNAGAVNPTVAQITDPNIGTPLGCTSINSQMIYDSNGGISQLFNVSNVGDPTTINGLNFASAESDSSALIRAYAYKQVANMFKGDSNELWWNSGQGNPPFDRIQGGIVNVGLGAAYSIAQTPDFLFYFGNDKQVHTLTGGTGAVDTPISTPAMAKQFQDYAVTADAISWTMELEGQWFYVITFPTQNITWCYPVGGEWFQWGSGLTGRIQGNDFADCYGLKIVEDYQSGKLFLLDAQTYTDNGNPIIRVRDSGPIYGELLKAPGKEFEIQRIEIILESGNGLVTGQGSMPKLGIQMSRDGGKTFGTQRLINAGQTGQEVTVSTGSFGRFKNCVVRLTCSDPIYWSIYAANAYVDACI